jgi:NAD(P)-dependent dehydrogenase (short-subunit alcohol dehydrogenase family)
MDRLAGRAAVITGGATGLGRAITERLLSEGARVAIGQLDAGANECPAGAEMWELDVRDDDAVLAFVERASQHFGRLDIAVANAALTGPPVVSPLLEHTGELFRAVLETNLVGAFVFARAAASAMLAAANGGRIVNIASVDSFVAEEFAAGYVASKAGLLGLTRACAVELAPHGITVNAVAPGQIFTDTGRAAQELRSDALVYRHYRDAPLGAGGQPQDVAGAVAYLVSDDARWVSGATLVVDGGYLAS